MQPLRQPHCWWCYCYYWWQWWGRREGDEVLLLMGDEQARGVTPFGLTTETPHRDAVVVLVLIDVEVAKTLAVGAGPVFSLPVTDTEAGPMVHGGGVEPHLP